MVVWQVIMSEQQPILHSLSQFEVPDHLSDFAQLSTMVLRRAHEKTLLLAGASINASYSGNAHRVFIEQRDPNRPYNYEFLAVHLGEACLTVCLEHRHDDELRDLEEYPRSTLVIEHGQAQTHHSFITRGPGPIETITDNEDAGFAMTRRLQHALSSIGIREAQERVLLTKAS